MENELYKQIGQRIKKARESSGISQEELAHQMGYTSPATISHFESGARKISVADLHSLSQILGLPFDYFSAPDNPDIDKGFRLRAAVVTPTTRKAVTDFLSFAQKHSEPVSIQDMTGLKPREAAAKFLEIAEIGGPPVILSQVAARIGVPVFHWDLPDEVSGIFVPYNGAACVGVNQNHPYVRQRFSIAHELGHLAYHEGKQLHVDFVEAEVGMQLDADQRDAEKIANQFAADLLMPAKWIRDDFTKYGVENLTLMAQKYQVSEQALWFRLINLKLVAESS